MALKSANAGSYAGAGYLISTLNGLETNATSGYSRWLDLDAALARTQWDEGNTTLLRYGGETKARPQ